MLKIKLARFGKRNQPHFRFVIIEARTKRDGEYTASIGHYAPTQTPKILEVDVEAYDMWIKKGAQPTDTVKGLVEKFKSGTPFPAKVKRPSKKAKAKAEADKKAAATQAEAEKAAKAAPAVEEAVAETAPEVTETPAEASAPVETTEAPTAEATPESK